MTREQMETEIAAAEQKIQEAQAVIHRCEGIVAVCRHYLAKLDEPPEPEPEKPA